MCARRSSPRELLILLRSLDIFLLNAVEFLQSLVADPKRDTNIASRDRYPIYTAGSLSRQRVVVMRFSGWHIDPPDSPLRNDPKKTESFFRGFKRTVTSG